ncbi:MAG TPA: triose-phosphate isomerase [Candidatus Sulfotelmatobacter sp.]|nr:triose-phosphate isomerase [Candidatus Sulfotelmatobacter sp.]
MDRKLIAGNWKMNGRRADAHQFAAALRRHLADRAPPCDMLICPPATLIETLRGALGDAPVALGGQDCHDAAKGAHTGDVAAPMLADLGCRYVIVGHSERRAAHHETDEAVAAKARAAQAAGLVPIVCLGETAAQRQAGETLAVVARQLAGSLSDALELARCVVAYEPVWAIGSGATPSADEIAQVHEHLRARLVARDKAAGAHVRLLYGGSAKPTNAASIVRIPAVDGLLVGGASLAADDFWAICAACA